MNSQCGTQPASWLGQPLKSFRDNKVRFRVYDRQEPDLIYLESLGPLAKPQRARQSDEPEPVEAVAAE